MQWSLVAHVLHGYIRSTWYHPWCLHVIMLSIVPSCMQSTPPASHHLESPSPHPFLVDIELLQLNSRECHSMATTAGAAAVDIVIHEAAQ